MLLHKRSPYLLLCSLLLLLFACRDKPVKQAFSVATVPDPMQQGHYVSNPDGLISPVAEQELNLLLDSLDRSGRAQVAVVLLKTIGDNVPKDVAHELFRTWKPGNAEKDNGLVVLLVDDQHRIEFETGYGLEGDLPDVICFRIQQQVMLPYFKQQDYDAGMLAGLQAVVRVLRPEGEDYAGSGRPAVTGTDNLADTAANTDANPEAAIAALMDSSMAGSMLPLINNAPPVNDEPIVNDIPPLQYARKQPGKAALVLLIINFILGNGIFIFMRRRHLPHADVTGGAAIQPLYRPGWIAWVCLFVLPAALIFSLANFTLFSFTSFTVALIIYGSWILFFTFYTIIVNRRAAGRLGNSSRHEQYLVWKTAEQSPVLSFLFPTPMFLFSRRLQKRLYELRSAPYSCEKCGKNMKRLSEKADNAFLEKFQAAEEDVRSVDYDVWQCKDCNTLQVYGYDNASSAITDCPECRHKTLKAGKREVMKSASTSSSGWGWQHYVCVFCGFKKQEKYTIPAKGSSSSSSSSFSSGSSSSSSSGSWGGGSSGGGGAGSSW